jgi:hypothetical protein
MHMKKKEMKISNRRPNAYLKRNILCGKQGIVAAGVSDLFASGDKQ